MLLSEMNPSFPYNPNGIGGGALGENRIPLRKISFDAELPYSAYLFGRKVIKWRN